MLFAIDFVYILPVAIFIAVAAAAWVLIELFSARKPRAEERLAELSDPRARREDKKKNDAVQKVLEKASPALAKPLQPKTELEQSKIKARLSEAGFRSEGAPGVFLSMKVIGLLIGVFFAGGTMVFLSGFSQKSLIRVIAVAGFLFYVPDFLVWFLARRRKQAIFLGLPDALDLMVVCVEAGLGLDQAMRKVSEEMKKSYRVIAEEFSISNFQIQMGKVRREVLQELGFAKRCR